MSVVAARAVVASAGAASLSRPSARPVSRAVPDRTRYIAAALRLGLRRSWRSPTSAMASTSSATTARLGSHPRSQSHEASPTPARARTSSAAAGQLRSLARRGGPCSVGSTSSPRADAPDAAWCSSRCARSSSVAGSCRVVERRRVEVDRVSEAVVVVPGGSARCCSMTSSSRRTRARRSQVERVGQQRGRAGAGRRAAERPGRRR